MDRNGPFELVCVRTCACSGLQYVCLRGIIEKTNLRHHVLHLLTFVCFSLSSSDWLWLSCVFEGHQGRLFLTYDLTALEDA